MSRLARRGWTKAYDEFLINPNPATTCNDHFDPVFHCPRGEGGTKAPKGLQSLNSSFERGPFYPSVRALCRPSGAKNPETPELGNGSIAWLNYLWKIPGRKIGPNPTLNNAGLVPQAPPTDFKMLGRLGSTKAC